MKIKKLILDMNYEEKSKNKMLLKLVTLNNYWIDKVSEDWATDMANNFLETSSNKKVLGKFNEINSILFSTLYQQIEKWAQEISNNKELAECVIRENFDGAKFEISKIENGIVEVNFIEPVEYSKTTWFYCQDESSIRNITDEMNHWEKNINITLGEEIYGWADEIKTYKYKVYSDWTLALEFWEEFCVRVKEYK